MFQQIMKLHVSFAYVDQLQGLPQKLGEYGIGAGEDCAGGGPWDGEKRGDEDDLVGGGGMSLG